MDVSKKRMIQRYGEGFYILFNKYIFKKSLSDVDTAHLLTIKTGKVIHHQTIKYWRIKLAIMHKPCEQCSHNKWKTRKKINKIRVEVECRSCGNVRELK